MDCSVVEFVGKELGQHGSNVYFKEFSVIVDGVKRSYKLGEFYFMRKDPQQPICIAEFQLIWVNLKDGRKLAAAKLYFRPEDTNSGRLCEHGEDELMEADRFVSVYCEQVPSWEYNSRVPFGTCAYDGVKLANQYINQHNELSSSVNCCCKVADNCKTHGIRTPVKVLSFPAYCRYRASMKLLATGCKLPRNLMIARGAVEVDCPKTRILFNRFKFQHPNIERFSLAEDIRIPQFKGRPRKRKQSKTKATNDAKKTRVEKENSIPESRNILQMSPKEELKPGRNQTYRIIAPPVDSNPDRNVIHVKIENKNDPGNSKGIKEEIEYSKVDELDNDFERSSMEAESASPDEDDDYKLAIFGDSKFFSDEMVADEEEMDVRRTRSVKREDSDEAPPSELVKNGKTGTILDEAFFREMKNGIIAGEGVDKEKMIKILVDSCKDQENFKRELFVFMKQRGTPIVYVPKVGYTRVDLPKLFSLVVSNGGYTQVTLNHKWKKVYDEMALATTITSAATCMRRHYEKLLLPFEKHLRLKHKQDALANKTYSITAQASQPLVLTIKKVKKESPVSPSESPDDSLRLSAHEADIIRSPTSIDCRHVETNQELISKSEIFHANSNASIKASTALSLAISPKEEHARNMDDRKFECIKLQQGQYPATFKIEPGSGETAKCMSSPDITKSDGSSQSHHATNTTSTTVCAIPLYKVSEHASSFRKNSHTTTVNAKTILPKQSSFVIPVVSAVPGANANVTVSSFVPSVSSTTMTYHPLHGNEVTVITKARPVENFGPLSVNSALQNIHLQNQSQPVFKKRRGRPPKHAKAQIQLLASSVQKAELGYFDRAPNKNGTVIHNYSPHVGGEVPRSMHVHDKSTFNNTRIATTTTAVRGTRMCATETERRSARKAPVKMYEYVMMSDSMNNKLVKHKQGVIRFPNFTDQNEMKIKDIAGMPPEYLNPSLYMRTVDYGELCQLSGVNRDTNQPRIESVMSFSSKGCVPSTLMYEGHRGGRSSPKAGDVDADRIEKPAKNELETEIHGIKEEHPDQQDDGLSNGAEARSVIVGPPPLIPISKEGKRNKRKLLEHGDIAMITKGPEYRPCTPNKSSSQQISLMSDMKALKESFDKTIDQSLQDLRRVTENGTDRETNHSSGQRDKMEVYAADNERQTERHGRMSDPMYKGKYLAVSNHGELKVLTDRMDARHEDLYINANHQIAGRDTEHKQEYSPEHDASDRLLRIASRDSFASQMPHEPVNVHHSSPHTREQPNFGTDSERNCRTRSALAYERAIIESYEQRGIGKSKFGDDLIHSKYLEAIYSQDKGISAIEHASSDCIEQSRVSKHSHGNRDQRKDPRSQTETHHHIDSHHYIAHLHEHGSHPFYHDRHHHDHHQNHRIDHNKNDHRHNGHKSDHRTDHHHSDHLSDHHQCSNRHRSDHPRSDHSLSDRHHNGHPYPASVSPSEDMAALRYSMHHSDHRSGRHITAFQDAAHLDYSHPALFPGRSNSPSFERKHMMGLDRSPPPSTIHHSWYSHHMAVVGKDGSKSMYWHQQVHH